MRAQNAMQAANRVQPQSQPTECKPATRCNRATRCRPRPCHRAQPDQSPEERSWQDQANCLGVDPDLFFPERGASTREAKEVCRGCVVREDCLEYALTNGEKFGIWGGMSERERRRLRRARAPRPPRPRPHRRGVGVAGV